MIEIEAVYWSRLALAFYDRKSSVFGRRFRVEKTLVCVVMASDFENNKSGSNSSFFGFPVPPLVMASKPEADSDGWLF